MPPPEPSRKIDELLSAYSKKRREELQPGIELHPASRKALLQEVSETFANMESKPLPRKSSFGWWKWLAVTAVTAWVIFLVAYIKVPKVDYQIQAVAPPEVRHVAPTVLAAASEKRSMQPAVKDEPAHTTQTAAAMAVPTRTLRASNGELAAADAIGGAARRSAPETPVASSPPVNTAAPAPAPAAPASSVAPTVAAESAPVVPAQAVSDRRLFMRLSIRKQYRENVVSPPLPKVLTEFQVERSGNKVKVIDADGSIFEGDVVANSLNQQTGSYSFKVAGSSRTLVKEIVFNGAIDATAQGANATPCTGDVEVGRDTEFHLKAVPAQ